MKLSARLLAVVALLAVFASCGAREIDAQLEHARFALDRGEWDAAIANGRAALDADPSNVEAALLLSSAYAGRSGFGVMKLTAAIADASRDRDLFDAVRDAMTETIINIDDLRSAIAVLVDEFIPNRPENIRYDDAGLQAALLMLIEVYAASPFMAQPTIDGPIDVSQITPEMKDRVQEDLIAADDRSVDAGIDASDPLVTNMRETYCTLKRASGTAEGFDLDVYRDFVHCQLAPDDGAALSAAAGDFLSPLIASCADFTDDYDACAASGDTEL